MDLRQLRYFVQIVESGSLSRAAETLRIAQPSLSIHIRALEQELGVPLLLRHPRGVTATEAGMLLCDHARKILREVERSRDILHSHVVNPVGRVSVGLPTSACRGLALPLVQAAAERYPGIAIHIVEAMTGSLDEWIQLGRLDVALLYDHRAFEHVAWTEMMGEDLMLQVAPHSAVADRGFVRFAELAGLSLVLPGRPNVLRTLLEQIAARLGMHLTATDCDSLPGIRQLVRSGFATIMPHFAMTEEIERGEIVSVAIVEPVPSWRLSVVLSQRTLNLRAGQVVAEVLADVIADLVERGIWKESAATNRRAWVTQDLIGPEPTSAHPRQARPSTISETFRSMLKIRRAQARISASHNRTWELHNGSDRIEGGSRTGHRARRAGRAVCGTTPRPASSS